MTVLRVHNLAIAHGRSIIQPFDWQVNAGEKWAVLGANGAGKSSLLHALLGVERGVRDSIFYGENSLQNLSVQAQAHWRIWVAQQYVESFNITVSGALNSINPALTAEQARACLREFGLEQSRNAWVHELSGGERQRLSWAMAHACYTEHTQLCLLDEALAAQDLAWQHKLLQRMRHMPCAVIAAVHDLNQVQQFASHVLLLLPTTHGSVAQAGRVDEMMRESWLKQVYGVDLLCSDGWWRVSSAI
ncbi:MAG: ATP-binding cassette domain-containing protein [Formosimonas sp.]